MIKHIALFNLKDQADGRSKFENIERIRRNVERLNREIPVNKRVEMAEQLRRDRKLAWTVDVAVCAEFDTLENYDAYVSHPVHCEAAVFAASVSDHVEGITFESVFPFESESEALLMAGASA